MSIDPTTGEVVQDYEPTTFGETTDKNDLIGSTIIIHDSEEFDSADYGKSLAVHYLDSDGNEGVFLTTSSSPLGKQVVGALTKLGHFRCTLDKQTSKRGREFFVLAAAS